MAFRGKQYSGRGPFGQRAEPCHFFRGYHKRKAEQSFNVFSDYTAGALRSVGKRKYAFDESEIL